MIIYSLSICNDIINYLLYHLNIIAMRVLSAFWNNYLLYFYNDFILKKNLQKTLPSIKYDFDSICTCSNASIVPRTLEAIYYLFYVSKLLNKMYSRQLSRQDLSKPSCPAVAAAFSRPIRPNPVVMKGWPAASTALSLLLILPLRALRWSSLIAS